ncbi:MAG TPA: type I-C CRISPR-associated protein Cas8c/Csd1 [Lentisphaeria bacterium]|nr:MAG: type I-C CRISPR-associated protein Cas8c/Csd1 [Lentisphaerae bacterium GWF2_50_93]HCE44357.1 type I-C CRISPR-associated protein Cas8c/Csd1 [Lentisphaeria bacterium]
MILQALKEYYDRKAADPESGIAPPGWERKAIPFLLVITKDGKFVNFQDTREAYENKLLAKVFLVPSLGEKKGNGIKSNLFWENLEYALGIPVVSEKRNPDPERVVEQHAAFKQRISQLQGECTALTAVKSFLVKINVAEIQRDPLWQEVYELNQSILFAISGYGPITDDSEIKALIHSDMKSSPRSKACCLVTGESDEIVSLEPPVKGIRGAPPTGACLVGFQKNSGYDSFGKEQGGNAPIGKTASFSYTTALNHLLKDSAQRIQVGDATTVFWSEKKTLFESDALFFFSEPFKDNPDQNTEAVKALYSSIWNGTYIISDDDTRFYILGLSPNSARVSVRFWHVGTVKEIGQRLQQHIDDLSIVCGKDDRSLPLRKLLRSIAAQEEDKNIPPNLAGDTMRSILEGLPYPETLLQATVRRIKAEQAKKDNKSGKSLPNVSYPRAALIKACINRKTRYKNPNIKEELKMSLDPTNTKIGYRLGRLFATLEKIQTEASPGLNATIRDKFYGAASSTPATVFGNLMRLSNHHLSKLEKEKTGLFKVRKKLLGEIIDGVESKISFPPHLNLEDQGRFAIGYYHQTQDFYTKKENK